MNRIAMRLGVVAALLAAGAAGVVFAEILGIATQPGGSATQLQYNNGGVFKGAAGSSVSGSTVTVGEIHASTAAFGAASNVSTFTKTGALNMASGAPITLAGSGGYVTSASSVNASAFFGDGSHMTGVPSTSSIAGVYLPLAGGTMTGTLNSTASGGIAATYGVSAGSVTVPNSILTSTTTILQGPVGIGTASPGPNSASDMLDVNRSASDVSIALNGQTTLKRTSATGSTTILGNAGDIIIAPSGVETMRAKNGGNVGIGTASPTTNSGLLGWSPVLVSSGSFGTLAVAQTAGRQWDMAAVTFSGTPSFAIANDFKGTFNFVINDSGNVGIGTTNPASALHVVGVVISTGVTGVSRPEMDFYDSGNTANNRNWAWRAAIKNNGDFGLIRSNGPTDAPTAGNNVVMLTDQTGMIQLGIGNSSVTYNASQGSMSFGQGNGFSAGASKIESLSDNGLTLHGATGTSARQFTLMDSGGGNRFIDVDNTGNVNLEGAGAGNVTVKAGANILYRCATAGALPAGALTITAASCGSTVDTGLRIP